MADLEHLGRIVAHVAQRLRDGVGVHAANCRRKGGAGGGRETSEQIGQVRVGSRQHFSYPAQNAVLVPASGLLPAGLVAGQRPFQWSQRASSRSAQPARIALVRPVRPCPRCWRIRRRYVGCLVRVQSSSAACGHQLLQSGPRPFATTAVGVEAVPTKTVR